MTHTIVFDNASLQALQLVHLYAYNFPYSAWVWRTRDDVRYNSPSKASYDWAQFYIMDPFVENAQLSAVLLQNRDVNSIYTGVPAVNGSFTINGDPPENISYDWWRDHRESMSFFMGLRKIIDPFNQGAYNPNEKDCKHVTQTGSSIYRPSLDVLEGFERNSIPDIVYGLPSYAFTSGRGPQRGYWDGDLQSITGAGYVASTRYSRSTIWDLASDVELHNATSEWSFSDGYRGWINEYRVYLDPHDLSWDGYWDIIVPYHLLYTTHGRNASRGTAEVLFKRTLKIRSYPVPQGFDPSVSGWPSLKTVTTLMCETEVVDKSYSGFTTDPDKVLVLWNSLVGEWSYTVGNERTDGKGFSFQSALATLSDPISLPAARGLFSYRRRKVRAEVERDLHNLRPVSFHSTADALRKFEDVLGTNFLETLAEGTGALAVLPSVSEAIQTITALRRRDIKGSLKNALDLVTATTLWWKFSFSPTSSDARNFFEHYDDVVNRLRSQGVWGQQTLYGEFHVDLPDGSYSWGPVHLESHSKVRLVFNDSTLSTLYFGLNALGIAPTLSNLWDCVPFSFVVDWFTNNGDRLADADTQARLLTLQHINSVHSIKVSFGLDGLYPGLQMGADAATTYYYRWQSVYTASLRPSRHDFHPVDSPLEEGKERLGTLGSLVWQLIGA